MRKFFGFLLVALGIVWLPTCISTEPAIMIGRLLGNTLITFLPAYFLLRKSGKKKDEENNL